MKREALLSSGETVIFANNSSHFEDCIIERLGIHDVKVFDYLLNSYERSKTSESKSWNQSDNSKRFIRSCQDMILNYLALAIHTEEIFEDADVSIPDLGDITHGLLLRNEIDIIADKIIKLIFWRMPFSLIADMRDNLPGFTSVVEKVLVMSLHIIKNTHITSPKLATATQLIGDILAINEFSDCLFSLPDSPMYIYN